MEECISQPSPSRRTPLKSLLKKSFDNDESLSLPEEPLTTVRERSCSPRKAVHFSDVDQIKLMSQESLVSTAPSDGSSTNAEVMAVNATQVTCSSRHVQPQGVEVANDDIPQRNQLMPPLL